MSPDTAFIPPNVTPPDPPEAKVVAFIFSSLMLVVMLTFVGFVCVEFFAEMIGHPLYFTSPPQKNETVFSKPDIKRSTEAPFELVTPKHQTQMKGPGIVVIYTQRESDSSTTPPKLLLDGKPHPWKTQYGDDTWFARCQLEAGLHRVQAEQAEAEFIVAESDDFVPQSPDQWAWHHPHPGIDDVERCQDCHTMVDIPIATFSADRRKTIGSWKGRASCFNCHDADEYAIRHAALQPMSNQCLRCHSMH